MKLKNKAKLMLDATTFRQSWSRARRLARLRLRRRRRDSIFVDDPRSTLSEDCAAARLSRRAGEDQTMSVAQVGAASACDSCNIVWQVHKQLSLSKSCIYIYIYIYRQPSWGCCLGIYTGNFRLLELECQLIGSRTRGVFYFQRKRV